MHNAKDHPFCKHRKQFSAYDKLFDWLEIVSRYNWPKVQIFACSSLSPSDDQLLRSGNPCKYMPMCVTMEIWPDFKGFSGTCISLVEASHIFPWQGNANCNLFVKPPGPGQANNICYKSTWEVHLREFCISAQLTAFCETWLELYLTTPLGLVVAASYCQTAQLTAVSPYQIGAPLCTYRWVKSRTSLISIYTHVYEYKAI